MTWSDLYLLCFLVGFTLSVLSFLAGAVHIHLPFKMHFPSHGGAHTGGHIGAAHGAAHASGPAGKGISHDASNHLTWFNATTVMAFLAWFGGVGYILAMHSHLAVLESLAVSIFSGIAAS